MYVALCMWQGLGGLPCGPLRNVGEGYRDEQARHRRMVETVQHPTAGNIPLAGGWPHSLPPYPLLPFSSSSPHVIFFSGLVACVAVAGIPVKYSESQPAIRLPPPLLGQHTKEVLQGLLDYSQDKVGPTTHLLSSHPPPSSSVHAEEANEVLPGG